MGEGTAIGGGKVGGGRDGGVDVDCKVAKRGKGKKARADVGGGGWGGIRGWCREGGGRRGGQVGMGWGEGIGEIALWWRGVAVEKAITGWWSEGLGRRGEQSGRNGRRKG